MKELKSQKGENLLSKLKTEIKEHGLRDILVVVAVLYVGGLLAQGFRLPIALNELTENGFTGNMSERISMCFSLNPIKSIWTSISTVSGILCVLLTIGMGWLGWYYGIKPRIKEETGKKDSRNFKIADEGTYGTSSLMQEKEEIEKILDLKEVGKQEGNILGKLEGKVLSIPSEREFDEKAKRLNWEIEDIINNKLNTNMVVIGAPGTMKTRAVVRNQIIQAAKREESMIMTDPKGELVEDTAEYLKGLGYKVRIFNLVNLRNSDSWNCVATIGTDSIVAKIFADAVAENAGKGNDSYFVNNAAIILKAVSLYVIESDSEKEKTMGRVYDILSGCTVEHIDSLFKTLPEKSVARRAYNAFERCNENVKGQILNNISAMLSVFQDDAVRSITSTDEIDLEEVCYEKCAYFLITSDQHTSFDFLAVLFYSMSFVKQVEAIDKERGKREAGLPYRATRPINYIMDEFSNLGQIPDFTKKISTTRSRKINIIVIIQNLPQLKNRYPNDQWQEILGCCDTMIFLGCTDTMTAEYISKRTGIATIEVESTNSTYDRQVIMLNQETSYHEVKSRGQRKVMNEDEVLRMKNTDELIFLRCQKPILCQKFDYSLHPESKKFIKSSAADYIPEWRRKEEAEKAEGEKKAEGIMKMEEEENQRRILEVERKAKNNEYDKKAMFDIGKEDIKEKSKKESEDKIKTTKSTPKAKKEIDTFLGGISEEVLTDIEETKRGEDKKENSANTESSDELNIIARTTKSSQKDTEEVKNDMTYYEYEEDEEEGIPDSEREYE